LTRGRNTLRRPKFFWIPAGRALGSQAFLSIVEKHEREGKDMAFVLGGADGLPEPWRSRAHVLLGLSPMTMPHELARVVLAEQIYRALTALRGHPLSALEASVRGRGTRVSRRIRP